MWPQLSLSTPDKASKRVSCIILILHHIMCCPFWQKVVGHMPFSDGITLQGAGIDGSMVAWMTVL